METGHTRDTRAYTGTRITLTNLTTIKTHQHTNTPARPHEHDRIRGRLNSPPAFFARFKDTGGAGILWTLHFSVAHDLAATVPDTGQ